MRSPSQHTFARVPQTYIPRSSFNRSHGHKTTFDAGYLIPVFTDFALPGDTFNMRMSAFVRLATPMKPVMDNMYLDTFFFAIPIRLIWDNFEKFMGEQVNPGDSIDYVIPQMTGPNVAGGGIAVGSLSDYFGIPVGALSAGGGATTGITFNSLWHRAYNLVYNEWFRDQNLQDSVIVDKDDGPDTYSDYVLLRRGKRHDYFTSALPFPQKGDPVELPLGDSAPISGLGNLAVSGQNIVFRNSAGGAGTVRTVRAGDDSTGVPAGSVYLNNPPTGVGSEEFHAFLPQFNVPYGTIAAGLTAELNDATSITVNALRQGIAVQQLLERDARGGSRYTEINRSHFGVVSPDARLQRPEYLGGGSSFINVHPIAQTSETTAETPQGNLAAFGTGSINNHGFTKSFTEHCVIIGLVSVRADITYQQGINRFFNIRTRYDIYWPAFANLGEQSILNREIYANLIDGTEAIGKDGVFGYQERYAEYRYKPSIITGLFRSNVSGSLDIWHLAQDFETQPTLNDDFIQENPPIDRVIAVPSEPHFLFDSHFSYKCARPMPVFSIPGLDKL